MKNNKTYIPITERATIQFLGYQHFWVTNIFGSFSLFLL